MTAERKSLTRDEVQRILAAIDLRTPAGAAVALLARGCSVSEIVQLRRRDVGADAARLVVGNTWLPLPPPLAQTLKTLTTRGEADGSLLGLSAAQVRRALQSAAKRAGVHGVTVEHLQVASRGPVLHVTRHVAAQEDALPSSVSLVDSRKLLGHPHQASVERYLATWPDRRR